MKIILEKSKCIGCGSCVAVCPKFFELSENGKPHLKGAEINSKTGNEELKIEKTDCADEAISLCPVECIHIKTT